MSSASGRLEAPSKIGQESGGSIDTNASTAGLQRLANWGKRAGRKGAVAGRPAGMWRWAANGGTMNGAGPGFHSAPQAGPVTCTNGFLHSKVDPAHVAVVVLAAHRALLPHLQHKNGAGRERSSTGCSTTVFTAVQQKQQSTARPVSPTKDSPLAAPAAAQHTLCRPGGCTGWPCTSAAPCTQGTRGRPRLGACASSAGRWQLTPAGALGARCCRGWCWGLHRHLRPHQQHCWGLHRHLRPHQPHCWGLRHRLLPHQPHCWGPHCQLLPRPAAHAAARHTALRPHAPGQAGWAACPGHQAPAGLPRPR